MGPSSQPEIETKETNNKEAKLWGGRFEESVTDAVEKFTESISFDKELYKHDIMGSKAHASMLSQQVFSFFPFQIDSVNCLFSEKMWGSRERGKKTLSLIFIFAYAIRLP